MAPTNWKIVQRTTQYTGYNIHLGAFIETKNFVWTRNFVHPLTEQSNFPDGNPTNLYSSQACYIITEQNNNINSTIS